jgi:hypothetical protein
VSAHVSHDRLIDLAAGLVAEPDAGTLLAHLRECGACEDRFRAICADLERSRLTSPRVSRRAVATWAAVAIAASLLGVVALSPLARRAAGTPEAYWLPVPSEAIDLRSIPQGGDGALFAEATESYRKQDASRVVKLLSGREIPESQDLLKLMLASALIKTGEPAAAQELLDALGIDTLPPPYRDRARWVRLAAWRAQSKRAEAEADACALAGEPGEFQEAAARLCASRERR